MIDDVTSQLRRGVVEYCVLGLLAGEPMYGWQLSSELITRDLIASIGTLYPLLARLRDRGLIVVFEQPAESDGPARKYYRLTSAGEDHLARFREQWPPFTSTVSEIIEKGLRR